MLGLAYPFGDFGQGSKNFPESKSIILDIAKQVYYISFHQVWSEQDYPNYPDKNSFMIKRISINSEWSSDSLLEVLDQPPIKHLNKLPDRGDLDGP